MQISTSKLVVPLDWDTDYFGFSVAKIVQDKVTEDELIDIFNYCRNNRIRLLEYACDSHDRSSVLLSEEYKFHFADIRLTFERFIREDEKWPAIPDGYQCVIAKSQHVSELMRMANGIYKSSRYCFDINFPQEKVKQFYSDWARKAVTGEFDNLAYLLCKGKQPVGFCTVRFEEEGVGRIALVGMDSNVSGQGLGKVLLGQTLKLMANKGVRKVEVITQGRNYVAQRLYQRAGFVTKNVQLWYHRWFDV